MSSNCIVKNIDSFCKTFIAISMNSGSFNNTKVDLEILGESDVDLNYGPLSSLKDQFKNVLPFFSSTDWMVVNSSCSKSESGVTTRYSLQDTFSIDANNHAIGLSNRVGGDDMLGSEYYGVSGVPTPNGYDVPADLLISRSKLISFHNFLRNGEYYIGTDGGLKRNYNHYSYKQTQNPSVDSLSAKGGHLGQYPNPYFDFGNILYRFSDLNNVSKHPINGDAGWEEGVNGMFDDTGNFFSVMNSILSAYGKIFVANPFLGGYYVHSPDQDLGKLSVLNDAKITVPENATSSSISKDYYSGYTSGAFLRTFRDGYMEKPLDVDDDLGSSSVSYSDIYGYDSDEERPRNLRIDRLLANIDPPTGWGNLPQSASISVSYQLAAAEIINSGLGLDYHIYDSLRDYNLITTIELNDKDKKRALDQRSDQLIYGEDPDDYYVYRGAQVQSIVDNARAEYLSMPTRFNENAVMNKLVPAFAIHNSTIGHGLRVHPDWLEYWIAKNGSLQYINYFDNKILLRNGHPTNSAFYGEGFTMGFENFGTANDNRGIKKWFSESGSPVLFVPINLPLAESPFAWFSNWSKFTTSGVDINVGEFMTEFVGDGILWTFDKKDEDEGIQGIIVVDRGEIDISYVRDTIQNLMHDFGDKASVMYDRDTVNFVDSNTYEAGVVIVPKDSYNGRPRISSLYYDLREVYQDAIESNNFGESYDTFSDKSVWYYGNAIKGKSIYNSHSGHQGSNTKLGYLANRNSVHNIRIAQRANVGRFETFVGNAGVPHPNRSLKTYEKEFSNYEGVNGNQIIYLTDSGKINSAAYNQDKENTMEVPNLSRISFTLVNELIDFEQGDAKTYNWKRYLESMDISISAGILTASYTFSQKILLPDYLSIESSKSTLQSLIKG